MSIDPQPTNPFGWLIILLLGLVFFLLGFPQSSPMSVTPERSMHPSVRGETPLPHMPLPANASLLQVETVETVIRESFPPQVSLTVSGYWPDGCDFAPQFAIQREGDQVFVSVYREVPPDVMCTMVLTPATLDISLTEALMEGDAFRAGDYSIDVNGVTVSASF